MSGIDNLFQEETLLSNIKIAAYFILLYEHFEDVVISTVKEFYAHDCVLNGQLFLSIDDAYIQCLETRIENGEKPCTHLKHSLESAKRERKIYKKEILGSKKNEDAKALRGSLKWLQEHYVISEEENELIFSIRKRRNTLVHELLKEIGNGLDEQDIQMIVKLLKLQQRINAWRVKQIDMPIMEIKLPKEVKPDDVMGGDDAVLESMFRILFCGEGPQFKEALEKESAKLLFKQQR